MPVITKKTEKNAQTIQIEAARELLEISPVKLHVFPRWFRRLCKDYYKKNVGSLRNIPASCVPREVLNHFCDSSLFDHWGITSAKKGGEFACCYLCGEDELFVCEPYPHGHGTECANRLATALNISWHFSGKSWWYPGNTLRFIFHPKLPCGVAQR
jgi:hypothetical protein